ncbi:hypothetical protein [Micromonospora humida]|uniref:Uncharacterized protein n=1 Tax=Micromonospora humida TaxID=2809018 RepID=A0ABS2IV26_9ACTN|nr:hypothetical protein [Micromonospora humida]MBM7078203.1 hypothetical protein [Micromonospora humida]
MTDPAKIDCPTDHQDPKGAAGPYDCQSFKWDPRTVELQAGKINSKLYAWARVTNAQPGDKFWIEMKNNTGETGPCYPVEFKSGRNCTDAIPWESGAHYRAGCTVKGTTKYTAWNTCQKK